MPDCAPPVGLLDGLTTQQLQAELAKAQTAYLAMMRGDKGVSYNYTQGDGSKGVTFTATTPQNLTYLIRQLQAALGINRGRRPMRPLYGV